MPTRPSTDMTLRLVQRARDFVSYVLRGGGHGRNLTGDERDQLETALTALGAVQVSMKTRLPSD